MRDLLVKAALCTFLVLLAASLSGCDEKVVVLNGHEEQTISGEKVFRLYNGDALKGIQIKDAKHGGGTKEIGMTFEDNLQDRFKEHPKTYTLTVTDNHTGVTQKITIIEDENTNGRRK